MKLIQKSSNSRVLLAVVIVLAVLIGATFSYDRISFARDTVQPSFEEVQVVPVTALDSGASMSTLSFGDLLKVCPSEKISNRMPTTIPNDNPPSVYFILDGERRELSEFDLPWVEENCSVEEQVVY